MFGLIVAPTRTQHHSTMQRHSATTITDRHVIGGGGATPVEGVVVTEDTPVGVNELFQLETEDFSLGGSPEELYAYYSWSDDAEAPSGMGICWSDDANEGNGDVVDALTTGGALRGGDDLLEQSPLHSMLLFIWH